MINQAIVVIDGDTKERSLAAEFDFLRTCDPCIVCPNDIRNGGPGICWCTIPFVFHGLFEDWFEGGTGWGE